MLHIKPPGHPSSNPAFSTKDKIMFITNENIFRLFARECGIGKYKDVFVKIISHILLIFHMEVSMNLL